MSREKSEPNPPDEELQRIIDSYRSAAEWDAAHASTADLKKQLKAVKEAADRLHTCVTELTPTARTLLTVAPPDGLAEFAEAAKLAHDSVPKRWLNSAPRLAAVSLHALFKHRGLDFAATAGGMGRPSRAVKTLLYIARSAGDRSMNPETARKWVEFALREHEAGGVL